MDSYIQKLDPLAGATIFGWEVPWTAVWSTLLAALPVVVLFYLLVPRRWLASKAGAAGALTAIVIAIFVYGMPWDSALWSFGYGVGFGLLPVGWTIFNAMLLYNITVETGQFSIIRRSVASLSGDARIQAILIGFSFGAFLEGAAGGGTPVAICGAIMVGLGFHPFQAAVLCLIANTSPVAYGGLGTPILVLNGVTELPGTAISTMAGHQLPILSLLIPAYMVKCMCSWRKTFEVWPALLVSGGSFAAFQFVFATAHEYKFLHNVVLYPMTDIGGGIFSLVATAIFLQFWKPKEEWHYDKPVATSTSGAALDAKDPHAAEAMALMSDQPKPVGDHETKPLTVGNVTLAWLPFIIMSVLLMLTGIVREKEGKGPVLIPGTGIQTNYMVPVPDLHEKTSRDAKLHPIKIEQSAALVFATTDPLGAAVNAQLAHQVAPRPEKALFNFAWLTAPGTAVFVAAILSMLVLRMSWPQVRRVLWRTVVQMKIPVPTIAFMIGLSYVTRYAGMDATLGVAFANTGALYPFFAPILGWLGVFLTGTDAGSNALFGSLQKITASTIYPDHIDPNLLTEGQTQVLICTSNSTGGVMGKMIDAQSICVATAATHQLGKEADIFKAVVWHSILLASIVGVMTMLQAYVYPFTLLVPHPVRFEATMKSAYDVAIAGAGLIGLAHAYHLAKRGLRVAVFERQPRAQGASIRNFGMLWPIGQPPGALYQLARRSLEIWLEVLRGAGIWHDLAGSLHLAYHDDEAAVLREFVALAGPECSCSMLTAAEIGQRFPAIVQTGLCAGMWSPVETTVDPRQVIAELPGWLNRTHGVDFFYAAPVLGYDCPTVHTAIGDTHAHRLLVCTGIGYRELAPDFFAGAGMIACKLQMMRSQPFERFRAGPMLAAGLTLRHYRAFAGCPTLPRLIERLDRELPEYGRFGIHVLVSQNGSGELSIGDSHEYGDAIEPFDKPAIDELILRYLAGFLRVPELRIASRWHGIYLKHPSAPYVVADPRPGMRVVTGVGGNGMTLSFGLAEQTVADWLDS